MKSKHASVELQFNWIFVLVVGALILLLFMAIVFKQQSTAEVSRQNAVLKNLKAIIVGSESNTDTTSLVTLPQEIVEFSCNSMRIDSQSQQFQHMMLFVQSELSTKPLSLVTREWSVPFRITNFVYLFSPRVRYVFVGTNPLIDELREFIPENIPVDVYTSLPTDFEFSNDDHVRFIFFGTGALPGVPVDVRALDNGRVSALQIQGTTEGGRVVFYGKVTSSWNALQTFSYLELESLLGAVASDDPSIYRCVMNNAFDKTEIISTIYKERAETLLSRNGNPRCSPSYQSAIEAMNAIVLASTQFSDRSVGQVQQSIQTLNSVNKQLQLLSCPLVY